MNFKEALLEYRTKTSSAFINFLINYKKSDDAFHLFYEGKDDYSFYTNFVDAHIPNKKFTYSCNGKSKAQTIFKRIDWSSHNKHRVLFLIDKDYQDLLEEAPLIDSNVFTTVCYSIENYLVNERMLERVIKENIGVDKEAVIEFVTERFRQALIKFYKFARTVSAWILFMKKQSDVVLTNVHLSDIYTIDNDLNFRRLKSHKRLAYLLDKTKLKSTGPCMKHVRPWESKLSNLNNPKQYVRGKFEAEFLVAFLQKVPMSLNNGRQIGERVFGYSTVITKNNFVDYLAPRQPIPQELEHFLMSNYASFKLTA